MSEELPSRRYTCIACGRKGRRNNSAQDRLKEPVCPWCEGEANTKLQDVSSKLADALLERDEAREDAEHWKIEYEIVQARLHGVKHERDNGIVSEREIIPKLRKLAEQAIDALGWFHETSAQRLQEELNQIKEGAK